MAVGFSSPYAAMQDKGIDDAKAKADAAASAFDAQASKYNAEMDKSKAETGKVKGIIAGQEERLNWARWRCWFGR